MIIILARLYLPMQCNAMDHAGKIQSCQIFLIKTPLTRCQGGDTAWLSTCREKQEIIGQTPLKIVREN